MEGAVSQAMPKTIEVVILEGDPFTDDDRDFRKRIPTPLSQPSMSQDRARKIIELDASQDLFERPTLDEIADALAVLRGPTHLPTPVDTPPKKRKRIGPSLTPAPATGWLRKLRDCPQR